MKNDHLDIHNYAIPPIIDIIRHSQKIKSDLPFKIYSTPAHSKLLHIRISMNSEENSPQLNFAHLTVEMKFTDATGEEKTQLNIFERRLDNKIKNSWRLCFIEDPIA